MRTFEEKGDRGWGVGGRERKLAPLAFLSKNPERSEAPSPTPHPLLPTPFFSPLLRFSATKITAPGAHS